MRRAGAVMAWILLTSILLAASCSTGGPRQTRLMKASKMTISSATLRVQMRALADRFSGLMEEVGEAVLRRETDPDRRRRALLWLTNGIPAMQQALFQPDPLAALVDAQFLIAQMRQFFAVKGEGSLARDYQAIANRMLDEMEADLKLIVENAGPETDYEAARSFIYDKAGDFPIDSSFASRRGSAAMLAEFTARAGTGAFASIGSITETVEDLVARIDLNAEYIPKLARWQAQLLLMDEIKSDADYEAVVSAVQQLQHLEMVAAFLEDLDPILADLPGLVSGEREIVLQAVDRYLQETLEFVDGQRALLMHEDVRDQREAILSAIREERMAVLSAVAEERRIVLEAVGREREAAFEDLDRLMDDAFTREVNKLFVRGLILISLFLIGFAGIVSLGIRALDRKTD